MYFSTVTIIKDIILGTMIEHLFTVQYDKNFMSVIFISI